MFFMWRIGMCILLAAPLLRAQAPAPATDESAVKALIERYVNARDARDAKAVGALLTADADQYTTAGAWRRGHAQVVAGTAESTKQNPGDRSIDIQSIRFVTPDVAIADGHYNIAGSEVRRWTTIVLKRDAGVWHISAIRNMAPTGGSARGR
jgi:uncharacterized protein (TIGR02246 family)